ncbi:glycosyltransferase family 2 protein [Lichenifustis flavocetrariae]|uniref:Glycosyltransferase family 2 protein n=1 Tax=Lichenifustis flavocetrariae TaxID=2949735 RepID=A0AA42CKP9_9HYPH|nr:glycosyltransferase family 2 protein [Lichenifustis flavocetrariae]MCW6506515.1 glycosyltransferase family 2 protein [Lichenifustis flavocetrariae]
MTTLSVAMATYNGARFLRHQLDSLAAQALLPDELVVTDDGSTDATLALLEDFAASAPFPVRVHRNRDQLGYRANFLHCASLCTGDLIAFCDQDDVWLPTKLATQVAQLDDAEVQLCCHNVLLVDSQGQSLGRTFQQWDMPPRFTFRSGPPFCFSIGFTLVFRRRLLAFASQWPLSRDENEPHLRMAHDQWFCFLALALGTIAFVPEVLAHYRQHDRNTSGPRSVWDGVSPDAAELLASRRAEYRRLSVAARNRADLLAAMVAAAEPADRPILATAEAHYAVLHKTLGRRRDFYHSASASQGLWRLFAAVCHGDYRVGSRWHFTPRNLIRDMLLLGALGTAQPGGAPEGSS